jgi:hypothetical protein
MVGETMIRHWRDCVEDAERLLGLAKARSAVPVKTLECLYDAMVQISRAVMELEHGGRDE